MTAGGGIVAHPDGPAAGVRCHARGLGRGGRRHPARRARPRPSRARPRPGHPPHDPTRDRCRTGRSSPSTATTSRARSAAMEALAFAGLDTVLFLEPPTPGAARRLCRLSAASASPASRAPATPHGWTSICRRSSGCCGRSAAPVVHYKVCSTFDSAPHVGSIGRAIDIAAELFEGWMPAAWSASRRWAASSASATSSRSPDGRGLPARPAPDHVAASGHADGRGRPRPPPGAADREADRPRRLRRR